MANVTVTHERAYHLRYIDWPSVLQRRADGEQWKVIAADIPMHPAALRRRHRVMVARAHARLDRMLSTLPTNGC